MRFDSIHPAVSLLYFAAVLAGTACFRHPVYLGISFCCAFACAVGRNGWRGLRFGLCMAPLALLLAAWYASYHHFGVTLLWVNSIGNRVTLESLACGLTLGVTAAALLLWLSCVHAVFTADKVVYLFGRVSPRLALFLAILLRMTPRVKTQAHRIQTAQQAIGRGVNQGNVLRRVRNALRLVSILITWTLESCAAISDSMRARGCTLPGRTAYSLYRFDGRDRGLLLAVSACLSLTLMAVLFHQTGARFDPRIVVNPTTPISFVFYGGYALLCLLPLIVQTVGELRFRHQRAAQ